MHRPAIEGTTVLTPGQGFVVMAGLAAIVVGLVALPDAYQYREASGEGMRLGFPAAVMTLGGLVAFGGAALMWRASTRTSGRPAMIARLATGLAITAVLACVAVAWRIGSGYGSGPAA